MAKMTKAALIEHLEGILEYSADMAKSVDADEPDNVWQADVDALTQAIEFIRSTTIVSVCIYRDSTGLYTDEECNQSNLEDFDLPEEILRRWHDACFLSSYEHWLDEYTADDTDGLYQFAIEHGFTPIPTGRCL